jgi:hypothetical protein
MYAAQENGRTMPLVPRIDSPPRMPRRGFMVFSASASPPSTLTVTSKPPVAAFGGQRLR